MCYNERMSGTINTTAFDRATEPVLGILSTDQVHKIVDYHADESLQATIEQLAHKANEGELTDDERAEYEGYAEAKALPALIAMLNPIKKVSKTIEAVTDAALPGGKGKGKGSDTKTASATPDCPGGNCGRKNPDGTAACFIAGTPVWTRDGMKPIEQVRAGDVVLSRDIITGQTVYKPVKHAFSKHARVLWLTLERADGRLVPGCEVRESVKPPE